MGVLALFSGFLTEAVLVFIATVCFVLWKVSRSVLSVQFFISQCEQGPEEAGHICNVIRHPAFFSIV